MAKSDIFTPDDICKLMTDKLGILKTNLLEPSVGTGNLLKYINIGDYKQVDVYDINKDYLNLIEYKNINKYCLDFLETDIFTQYDNIIMNPPYIKIQDIDPDYRKFLKEKFNLFGTIDIYYAFIIKCIELLSPTGTLVCITPNTYLYNKSALSLRKYLFDNNLIKEIIDFGYKKVFNVSVYCCITIIDKSQKTHLIYNDSEIEYENLKNNYSLFNLNNSSSKKLSDICKISNGIATLRDKIYIHDDKLYDEKCWTKIINAGYEEKYIIYPYKNGKIIKEDNFRNQNPQTYEYLLEHKLELKKRDKGKKIYPSWYAYGRSQSVNITSNDDLCIYVPCFLNPEEFDIYIKPTMLFKSCLCIKPHNQSDINKIFDIIKNNIEFIKLNSPKKSNGWINISSRILNQINF